jgi:hypothetical protein
MRWLGIARCGEVGSSGQKGARVVARCVGLEGVWPVPGSAICAALARAHLVPGGTGGSAICAALARAHPQKQQDVKG